MAIIGCSQPAAAQTEGLSMADSTIVCGFLGAGKMATALAKGWRAAALLDVQRSRASDPMPQARQSFQADTGLAAGADNREVVADAELLVLAVKPQSMSALL